MDQRRWESQKNEPNQQNDQALRLDPGDLSIMELPPPGLPCFSPPGPAVMPTISW
jgi:hypothetical protein